MFRLPKLETKTKRMLGIWLAWTIIVLLAYVYGSFSPNRFAERKIVRSTEQQMIEKAKTFGFHQPDFHYNDSKSFIFATQQCVAYLNLTVEPAERVPVSIIVAMAIVESNYGTSRFAQEGNALFGVRTWNMKQPHMKPLGIPNARFGVKKYVHKCESVADMIRILNTHPAYKEFRKERDHQMYNGRPWNYRPLMNGIRAWSTNTDYADLILDTIKENNLP
jgi:flagellum-specific peptidoglycan hydrolase FlgJ